jgi:tRNA G10  N-methylase Trm11
VDAMLAGQSVDIFYCDPPWGDNSLSYWKGMNRRMTGAVVPQLTHDELYDRFIDLIKRYVRGYVFIETGPRWVAYVAERLKIFRDVQTYSLTYDAGPDLPCGIICATTLETPWKLSFDPGPYRGAELVRRIVADVAKPGGIVLDPCCGMGYTARAAVAAKMRFRGNELNQARLDKTIAYLTKKAGK